MTVLTSLIAAEANSVADDVPRFVENGVKRFRVELLRETARQPRS